MLDESQLLSRRFRVLRLRFGTVRVKLIKQSFARAGDLAGTGRAREVKENLLALLPFVLVHGGGDLAEDRGDGVDLRGPDHPSLAASAVASGEVGVPVRSRPGFSAFARSTRALASEWETKTASRTNAVSVP